MTAPTEHAESRSDPRAVRVAALLPAWLGSIRFRLAALYSLVVWGIAALLVGGIYLFLARELQRQAVTDARLEFVAGQQCMRMPDGRASCFPVVDIDRESFASFLAAVEGNANARALEQFRRYSYTALAFLFVVSMTVGWVLADRALRPIGRITRVARRISATDLSQRIDLQRPPDELKELADTFDDMLGRIETAFEGQRSFIHEASHELRNPIAVIRTNVDVALADPDAPPEELRDTLGVVGKAAARMGVLVDDLLTYARREAPAERTTVLDLAEVVSETAAEFSV
ncbi:MAG: HAMP domain-containing histidine kinase, partial [Acidimicrobiia bacterium]|nr:HAMP domain-containing histidine kinase [Acidimicrobiia bacterium]